MYGEWTGTAGYYFQVGFSLLDSRWPTARLMPTHANVFQAILHRYKGRSAGVQPLAICWRKGKTTFTNRWPSIGAGTLLNHPICHASDVPCRLMTGDWYNSIMV